MRGVVGRLLERAVDQLHHLFIGNLARAARPRRVVQPFDALLGKAPAPLGDGRVRHIEALGDRFIGGAIGAGQDNLRPLDDAERIAA
jgi:hypothetical protein